MHYKKSELLLIARKIETQKKLSPREIAHFLEFRKKTEQYTIWKILKQAALPLSLFLGILLTMYPEFFDPIAKNMPSWTNLSPRLLLGIDYLWNVFSEPVGKSNILYHIPNIMLYSFGIFGVKRLVDAIDKRSWLDRVLLAQERLNEDITEGYLNVRLTKGHSLLFVGKGDYIGTQFATDHKENETITVSEVKPSYSDIWNFYSVDTMYEDLKDVLYRSDAGHAGEYIFFPVKDDQIFLPAADAYDLSPHKLDILCQNIRTVEKEEKLSTKRIIIVGDKYHKSYVHSEDRNRIVPNSKDIISLSSIAAKYTNVTLLDPSEIVLQKIIEIAEGRKIVFRATPSGIKEYKTRFYERLEKLKYKPDRKKKGILTIGYDIFEDQTEQQMLSRKIDDYFPVVLSKNVHDALIRNGYKKSEFIYVPELVLKVISKTAGEQ